jgi:hypothetical protein
VVRDEAEGLDELGTGDVPIDHHDDRTALFTPTSKECGLDHQLDRGPVDPEEHLCPWASLGPDHRVPTHALESEHRGLRRLDEDVIDATRPLPRI